MDKQDYDTYDRQDLLNEIDNLKRELVYYQANEKIEKATKRCSNCAIRDEEIENLEEKNNELQLLVNKQKQQIEQLEKDLQIQQEENLSKTKQIEQLQEQPIMKQSSQQTSILYQQQNELKDENVNNMSKQQNMSIGINQISGLNISSVEQSIPMQQVQLPKNQKRIVYNEFKKMKNRPEINSSIYSKVAAKKQGKMLSLD